MIPQAMITEWREHAPWVEDNQVEQDLVLCRVLVQLFSNSQFREKIAFRGGTSLFKLFILPPARYSEDLDFVQIKSEPIGEIVNIIREIVDPLLGQPKRNFKEGRVTLIYTFASESVPPISLRLKVEINTREHFTVFGFEEKQLSVQSRWFNGNAQIKTYTLNELMGTKLRALYQRKKGRDLFDLWIANQTGTLEADKVIKSFMKYMEHGNHGISRALFEQNMHEKFKSTRFLEDIKPLLAPTIDWDLKRAVNMINSQYISRLPGEPWAGAGETGI